ncbi:MAG: hypothetical protein LW870_19275 [Pirellula sp.]|nr:hypothetical protein [Pirellula sp.]
MRKYITKWTKLALVIAAVAGTQTGCNSGWKMPGKDMFSWSKKPTESSLAGSNPSLSVSGSSTGSGLASSGSGLATSGSPMSPSLKNTPTSMTNASKSPYGATSPAASYSSPQGLASNANGYQTGPYMTSSGGRPTGYTAPTGYGNAQPMGLAANSAGPNAALPMGMVNNTPPHSMPNAPGFQQPAQAPAIAQSGFNAPSGFGAQSGVPALPAGMSTTSMSNLPQPSSMPNAAPQGFASNQPNMNTSTLAAPAYGGAAPYRPGSTGRSTAYNFGAPQPSAATGQSLPTSNVPHTANGLPAPQPNLYR